MFRFATPWFLVLLVGLPLAFWLRRYRRQPVYLMASHRGDPKMPERSFVVVMASLLPLLKYLALALMIAALARPQWGTRKMNVTTEGINIVLALDLSESMAALDFKHEGRIVTRLEAVKGVVNDFIRKREGDRIAMVVFGTQAFTQLPLTRITIPSPLYWTA